VEQNLAGFSGTYFIGNVNSKTDVTINPKPVIFPGVSFSDQPTEKAFLAALKTEKSTPSAANEAVVQGFGVPATCFDSNNGIAPIAPNLSDTSGTSLGGVCYPSINMDPWTDPATGKHLSGSLFGGTAGSDGLPDGNPDPTRNYQALEFEVNKSLSHN